MHPKNRFGEEARYNSKYQPLINKTIFQNDKKKNEKQIHI